MIGCIAEHAALSAKVSRGMQSSCRHVISALQDACGEKEKKLREGAFLDRLTDRKIERRTDRENEIDKKSGVTNEEGEGQNRRNVKYDFWWKRLFPR